MLKSLLTGSVKLLTSETKLSTRQWIEKIMETHAPTSAFYVVNLNKVIERVNLWNTHLPNVKPYYAVKCNPDPVVLELLSSLGTSFDVASRGEIDLVKDLVKDTQKDIIYANPYKEASSLKYARTTGVNMTTFDCEHELWKIKLYHPDCNLFLRLKVDDSNSVVKFSHKFGATIEEAKSLINTCKEADLNLVGLSFHVGSSCQDPQQYHKALEMCSILDPDHRLTVDIGGGFHDPDMFVRISDIINKHPAKKIAEPGRFLVQNSHTLMLNVIGKKIRDNKRYYYLNDGLYGSFNCMIYDHQIPEITVYKDTHPKYPSVLFGPTCDGFDIVNNDISLPEMEIGDLLMVKKFGAYTIAGYSDFNGFSKIPSYYVV